VIQKLDGRQSSVSGIQLTGRLPWDAALTAAGRKYTREPNDENAAALLAERRRSAAEDVRLQVELGFDFVTDGGVGQTDLFSPYLDAVDGIKKGGNIDRYPGTRNSYYHVPLVDGKIGPPGATVKSRFFLGESEGVKKKAILPSPVAFALACENNHYSDRVGIARDFTALLGEEVRELASEGYEFVQLTECFLTSPRFATRVTKELKESFAEALDEIFQGYKGRSAVYFHSSDCSELLDQALDSAVTDVGFDFNTPVTALPPSMSKSLLLGLQNTTRKLPADFLADEVEILAKRFGDLTTELGDWVDGEVWLCPSQDYDGLQTYSQGVARLRNLGGALKALRGMN